MSLWMSFVHAVSFKEKQVWEIELSCEGEEVADGYFVVWVGGQ